MAMQITRRELRLLNFYRASELQGGLVLGALVRRVRDPELILRLTRHGAEEIRHAELWTETILAVGGKPWPTKDTYQSRYAALLGSLRSVVEVLALTQVFERRVYRHFIEHERRPDTHPRVRACLRTMVEEERDHLSWVWRWLTGRGGTPIARLEALMRRFQAADDEVYEQVFEEYAWQRAA